MPFLTIFQLHFTSTLHLPTPRSQINATVSFRNYHKINKEKMKTDFISSDLISNPSNDADTLYKQYHTTSTTLIDKHAPLHTKHTKAKYIPGWVNDAVIATKRPSVYLKGSGAKINLISTDLNTCKKSTNTTEPASRQNPNFLKQRFRITIMTPKNYGESLAMCYTDSQPGCYHR